MLIYKIILCFYISLQLYCLDCIGLFTNVCWTRLNSASRTAAPRTKLFSRCKPTDLRVWLCHFLMAMTKVTWSGNWSKRLFIEDDWDLEGWNAVSPSSEDNGFHYSLFQRLHYESDAITAFTRFLTHYLDPHLQVKFVGMGTRKHWSVEELYWTLNLDCNIQSRLGLLQGQSRLADAIFSDQEFLSIQHRWRHLMYRLLKQDRLFYPTTHSMNHFQRQTKKCQRVHP